MKIKQRLIEYEEEFYEPVIYSSEEENYDDY
jgi:hypothetical protein